MDITIHRDGQNYGPYTLEQIQEYLGNGSLDENDFAWYEGCANWLPIKDVTSSLTASLPPPLKLPPPLPPVVTPLTRATNLTSSETTQARVHTSIKTSGNRHLLTGKIVGLIIGVAVTLIVIIGLSHRIYTVSDLSTQPQDSVQRIHLDADSIVGTYSGTDQWQNTVIVQFNNDYTYTFTTKSSLNEQPITGHWKIDTTTKENDYLRLLSSMGLDMYGLDPVPNHPGTFVDSLLHLSIAKSNSERSTVTRSAPIETKPNMTASIVTSVTPDSPISQVSQAPTMKGTSVQTSINSDQPGTPSPVALPSLTPQSTVVATGPIFGQPWTNSLGMKFVPAGTDNVLFCIWDVRVKDFQTYVQATGYQQTGGIFVMKEETDERGEHSLGFGLDPNASWEHPGFEQGPTCPVVGVSWNEAIAFCQWLTRKEQKEGKLGNTQMYRLPTDAEWSTAGGDEECPWGYGNPIPKDAGNYGDQALISNLPGINDPGLPENDGYPWTSPVGSFRPNSYGLYDMGGNVWQWCMDWYQASMNGEGLRLKIPDLADDGGGHEYKVLRGASWFDGVHDDTDALASSYRNDFEPGVRNGIIGFRVVLVDSSSSTMSQSAAASQIASTPTTTANANEASQDDYDHQWQNELSAFLQPIFNQALASKGLWQREDRWNNPDNLVTWQLFHGIEPGNHARLMLGVTDQARRIPQQSTECEGTWEWNLPQDGVQPLVIVRFDPSFAPTKEKGAITESPYVWLEDNLSDRDFLDLLRKIDALKISFMAKNSLLSDNSYEVNTDGNGIPHLLLTTIGFKKIDKEDALSLFDLAIGGRADLIEKRVPTKEQINDITSAPLPLMAAAMLSQSILTAESLQKMQADITLEFSPDESTPIGQLIKQFFNTNNDMDKTPRGIANCFIYYDKTDTGNPIQRLFVNSKDNHYIGSFHRVKNDTGSNWEAVKPSDLSATIYTAGFSALTAYVENSQGFGGVMPSWIKEGGYWIALNSPSSGLWFILPYNTDPDPAIIALTNQALDKAEDISKKAVENKINNITKTYQVTDGATTFDCSLQLYPDPSDWALKITNKAGYLYDLERISDFNGDIKYTTLRWAINNASNISRQARAAFNNVISNASSSEKIKAVLAPTFPYNLPRDLASQLQKTYAQYFTSVRFGTPIIDKDTGIAYYPIPSSQAGDVWLIKLTPKESLDGDIEVNTRNYSINTEVIRCKSNESDPSKGETLYEIITWSDDRHRDAALPFYYFAQAAKATGARDVKELFSDQFPLYNGCQVTADGQILFNPDPVPPYLANSNAGNSTPIHYINAEEIPVFYLLTNKEILEKVMAAYQIQLRAIMKDRLNNKLNKLN